MSTQKRSDKLFEVMRFIIAILIAFGISFIVISMSSEKPLEAIKYLFIGPLTTARRFSTVIETTIPLTFAGIAVCIMFRVNMFNLASEGAMFMSALIACMIGVFLPGNGVIVTIVAILAGAVTGMIICVIPGVLKVKWGASELVASIMLNTIMFQFGTFLLNKVVRDPSAAFAASYPLPKNVGLPVLITKTRLHAGIFIVAAIVVVATILVYNTRWGYKLRMTGANKDLVIMAGINSTAVILGAQMLGGAVAGIGGATEMLGMYSRFQWTALPGYGFDGVILNILAKKNPAYIPVAAFFLAYLRIGADYMHSHSDVAAEIVSIIQGIIIVLVAANAFLSGWKHKITTKASKEMLERSAA